MRFLAVILLLAAIGVAAAHPVWPMWLSGGVIVSFLLSCGVARAFPFLYPVLLVAGDAYPFTGQLVLQEYDSLLLGSLAGWTLRQFWAAHAELDSKTAGQRAAINPGQSVGAWLPWAGLAISVVIALGVGLSRLPSAPWGDQLSAYFTDHNAWRIAKGYAWGILFAAITMRQSGNGIVVWLRAFGRGMQLAAVYVALVMLLERTIFEDWVDFERQFRAVGPFFTMHIGDQHVDAFIVLAIPFAWIVGGGKAATRLAVGAFISLLMIFASLATMSRGTIAAVMLQIVLLALVFAIPARRASALAMLTRSSTLIVASAVVLLAIVAAIWKADAIHGRFARSGADWQTRVDHWARMITDTRPLDWCLGRGMGTLPTMMAKQQGRATPPVSWVGGSSVGALRLEPGWPLYVERYAWPADSRPLTLQLTIAPEPGELIASNAASDKGLVDEVPAANKTTTQLHLFRCYKSMLHSYESTTAEVAVRHDPLRVTQETDLQNASVTLPKPAIETYKPKARVWRPEAVGMSVSGDRGLMLWGSSNIGPAPWISASHSAPWTFTCDDHLIWRAKNAGVHLLYEHGMIGLIAFAALVWRVFCSRGQIDAADPSRGNRRYALVALVGFGVVAFFGTLIDTAWITALVLAVMAYAQRSASVSMANTTEMGRSDDALV